MIEVPWLRLSDSLQIAWQNLRRQTLGPNESGNKKLVDQTLNDVRRQHKLLASPRMGQNPWTVAASVAQVVVLAKDVMPDMLWHVAQLEALATLPSSLGYHCCPHQQHVCSCYIKQNDCVQLHFSSVCLILHEIQYIIVYHILHSIEIQ